MECVEFYSNLKDENIKLSDKQLLLFSQYYDFLIKSNKKTNLTSITNKPEVYAKHFYDSLTPLFDGEIKGEVLDVGSGAGFPGIPVKIVCPEIKLSIIDSANKKIKFLESLLKELDLPDVQLINARAEDYSKEKREYFDVVLSRAVAELPILCELCLPLTKVGGEFWALKGPKGLEELSLSTQAIELLGGEVKGVYHQQYSGQKRINICITKVKNTPKTYPRPYGAIVNQPR